MDKVSDFFTRTIAEYSTMKFLITEILLCLIAASVLGLIIGWLCKSAFAREKLRERESDWNTQRLGLESQHHSAIESVNSEKDKLLSKLNDTELEKNSLNDSLQANKSAVHKAHIEVQQLNKKQKDSHERLQKILADKDREIAQLQREQNESRKGKDNPPKPFGVAKAKPKNPARTKTLSTVTSTIGGKPDGLSGSANGFKPGTQARTEELDKTQLLNERNSEVATPDLKKAQSSAHKSYSDPLREATATERKARVESAEKTTTPTAPKPEQTAIPSVKPAPRKNDAQPDSNNSGDTVSFGTSANDTLDDTTVLDLNDYDATDPMHPRAAANFAETSRDLRDTVEPPKKKKSLWDRVKSSVSKTVDKTKL